MTRLRVLPKLRSTLAFACAAALSVAAPAQDCPTNYGAADAQPDGQFGSAIAIDGGIAVVGNRPRNGTSAGAVYVLDLAATTQLHKLTEPSAQSSSLFGGAVAVSGRTAVVGATGAGSSGAVYVFDTQTGALLHTLVPADTQLGMRFGHSVSIDGGRIVAGAPGADTGGADATGAAFVFDAESGAEIRTLRPTGPRIAGDSFGESVAIRGGTILVGARRDDSREAGVDEGAAYVFDASSGRLVRKIQPEDAVGKVNFGYSVALDDGIALVGAPFDDGKAKFAGAAFLFDVADGQQIAKLVLEEGQASDFLGFNVAMRGGYAAVAATLQQRRDDAGTVVVFDSHTGERLSTLPPGGSAPRDRFGTGLGIDDTWVVGGAPYDSDRSRESGEIRVFRLDELPDTPIVFDPKPVTTSFLVEITIPGFGTFRFRHTVTGRVIAQAPLDCKPPRSFQVTGFDLRAAGPPEVIEPVEGVSLTLNEPGIVLADAGAPVSVASDGSFSQQVMVGFTGTAQYATPGASGSRRLSDAAPVTVTLNGRLDTTGGPLTLTADIPRTSRDVDLGLGPLNPVVSVSGTFEGTRVTGRTVAPTPSVTRTAQVTLDFGAQTADAAKFAGTFDRRRAPNLSLGANATLRIGAFRADVVLDAKGRTAKGANPVVKLSVPKKRKKPSKFSVAVSKQALRDALAALPTADGLPQEVPWTLTLGDGWNIGGTLALNGKSRVRYGPGGVVRRATLNMLPVK